MIAKRVLRSQGASNFARLADYMLASQDKKISNDHMEAITRTIAYITGDDKAEGRVGAIRISNCYCDNPADALREIIVTQRINKRARSDRTYHLVVSFAKGEQPPPEQLHDIEDELCGAIGLGQHQRISAVHIDTEHLHMHIAINKIHPESFRCVEPYYDKRRLMAACEALEIKHGLVRTNHGIAPDASYENVKAFADWIGKALETQIKAGFAGTKDWQALHVLFKQYGLELRLRGAGLSIVDSASGLRVKASSIDKKLSLFQLEQRLGAFQAYSGSEITVISQFRPSTAHVATTGQLYDRYTRERERRIAEQKQAIAEYLERARKGVHGVIETYHNRSRNIAKSGFSARGKRDERQRLNAAYKQAMLKVQANKVAAIRTIRATYRPRTWTEFLEEEAAHGNADAQAALATQRRKKDLNGAHPQVMAAEKSAPTTKVKPAVQIVSREQVEQIPSPQKRRGRR